MGIGATVAAVEMIYKYSKRKRQEAQVKKLIEQQAGSTKQLERPARVFVMPAATPYIIARRDGAVWAGPWKNDGRGFTRVPKNWWRFASKAKAEQELESNDFLRHCTVEDAE